MRYRRVISMVLASGLMAVMIAAVPAAGANFLKDISVQKSGDTAVVIVSTTEPCEFDTLLISSGQERIVIDLKGVMNVWTEKKFPDLPFKSIQSIRTSQFQKEPLVTRVVLDINRPIGFTAVQRGNDILVKFPVAADETDFLEWRAQEMSGAEATPATAAETEPVPAATEEPELAPATPAAPPAAVETPAAKETPAAAETPAAKASEPERAEKTESAPETAAVAPPKQTTAGVKIESYPMRKEISYNAGGFRDPFMPLVGAAPGQISSELPILENLKLVGILEDVDGNRALLEDAEGNGYILEANDKVKNGYLVTVTETKAIFQITEYGWTRNVALELNLPELR